MATVGAEDAPHIVPITYALGNDVLWTAVDHKPKRTTQLRRLDNIRANPRVAVLVDEYADDWGALWWCRLDGTARIAGPAEVDAAVSALGAKYMQYRERPPGGPVIAIDVQRWTGWAYREAE